MMVWLLSLSLLPALAGCKRQAVLYDSELAKEGRNEETEAAQKTEDETADKTAEKTAEEASGGNSEEQQPETIRVYVCGEVTVPGVYGLLAGSRIEDAVKAAGGMTDAAARTWLNLAEPITDGQKIEVPSEEKAAQWEAAGIAAAGESGPGSAEVSGSRADGKVNLNRASAQELMTLPGIGESKAAEIIRYRESQGAFSKPEDLMKIPGIKEGVFHKIKDQITV